MFFKLIKKLIRAPKTIKSIYDKERLHYDFFSDVFTHLEEYLKPGSYTYTLKPKKIIYKKHHSSKKFINKLSKELDIKKLNFKDKFRKSLIEVLSNIFRKSFKVKRNITNVDNQFDLIMVLYQQHGYKLFDLELNNVLKIHLQNERYKSEKEIIEKLSDDISIPNHAFLTHKKMIVEKLVDFKPYSELTNQEILLGFKQFLDDYVGYIASQDQADLEQYEPEKLVKIYDKAFDGYDFWNTIKKEFKLVEKLKEDSEITYVEFKDDLKFKNFIITNRGQYYLIDFEMTSQVFSFAPLMVPMMDLGFSYEDDFVLKELFRGTFDSPLSKISEIINQDYSKNNRDVYLILAMLPPPQKLQQENTGVLDEELDKEALNENILKRLDILKQ